MTLLFKGGNTPDNPGDYRPITLLPIIGKLMTKIMANKIMEFCENKNILSRGQNGFRSNRSCNQHIFTVVEICERIKREQKSGALVFFLDLKNVLIGCVESMCCLA